MAVLGLDIADRMVQHEAVNMLPDLEEAVLCDDVLVPCLEESFISGIDDWWGSFIADMCL
ncbi:MAG: hypothetical protein LBQ58_02355 [Synergistaceae bacterium]|jgi:hypothetical protein|nr:hypothetical protein [Synergistaceae bacterium]